MKLSTRDQKGQSIIDFISDYTVIDIETTGLSPMWDEIIELAAIRVRDNKPVSAYQSLVKCSCPLDPFISDLTGITDDMLRDAPSLSTVIGPFCEFVGSDIIVGQNVSFDINFVYDACMRYCGKPFTNDYINIIRFSNKLLPNDVRKTLSSVCQFLDMSADGAHRAKRDCELAHQVYQKYLSMIDDHDAFKDLFKDHRKRGRSRNLDIKSILADPDFVPDENSEIYGKSFCFTGALDRMIRKDACQIVVNMGGTLTSGVSKKTDYLVLGSTDYCKTIKDGKTSKQKKAEKLQKDGHDIMVITEDVFYQMIEE